MLGYAIANPTYELIISSIHDVIMTEQINAHFLTDIEIKQFKCFKDFKASGFKRVNLIGGKNNVGKTAFMEACYINVSGDSINDLVRKIISAKFMRENLNFIAKEVKEDDVRTLLDSTKYYNTDSNVSAKLFSIKEENAKKEYNLKVNATEVVVNAKDINIDIGINAPSPDRHIYFIDNFGWADSELISVFQAIQKQDKENELNVLVREFDNSIENFKVIGDKPQCKTNGEYRDITEFGDGLKHYISIICALYACENGYLFIDEIDNGIYYDHLDRLWGIILTLSKQTNCQVFATTHSKEMLESFARVAEKLNEQDISFTTLVKNNNQEIKSITRDYEMILDSLADGREVR